MIVQFFFFVCDWPLLRLKRKKKSQELHAEVYWERLSRLKTSQNCSVLTQKKNWTRHSSNESSVVIALINVQTRI